MELKDLFYLLIKDYWENVQNRPEEKAERKLLSLFHLSGEENKYKALIHFKDYAYERNIAGAASAYRDVANKALFFLKTEDWKRDNIEADIWGRFVEECRHRGDEGIKPNVRVNPLKPSSGGKKSLFAFVRDVAGNDTIADWTFKMITEGRALEAHMTLKTIWGVGDKIASFYMRDIYWLGHGINPDPECIIKADYLLQPIDIWVERAGSALGYKGKSKEDLAQFISSFEKEIKIAHGGLNIGCWMLGSNYVRDIKNFDNIIQVITNKNKDKNIAFSIANRYELFFGKFGTILKSIIKMDSHD